MTNAPTSQDAQTSAEAAVDPAHDPFAEADAAMIAGDLAQLGRLAEIGMEMAEDLPRKAAQLKPYGAEKYEAQVASLIARAYKDVATPVQTSIALRAKLMETRRKRWLGRAAPPPAAPKPTPDKAADKTRPPRRRDPVGDLVGNLFRSVDRNLVSEKVLGKLAELEKEPIGVMLAKLAKALDLEVDWPKFISEQWTWPEIEARDPRSPFAFLWDNTRWARATPANDPASRGGPEPDTPPPG